VNPVSTLLAPLLLLLPGAFGAEVAVPVLAAPVVPVALDALEQGQRPWQQVSIEQRFTVRITPRAVAAPAFFDDAADAEAPRFTERKMGKCVPVAGIVGMQYGRPDRLILYLRDRRIVSATLEKACRAADFYSGFYVAKNGDGMLCTKRDEILSRSGANCQLSALRQIVEVDD
jgi:hypothetical protein